MIETRPTWIIHRGAGCPAVLDAAREPIRTHAPQRCGRCGDPAGAYRFRDVVSDNFIPTSNSSVLLGGVDSLCVACAFCARDLRLRCAPFFARESGVWFVRTRYLLPLLLDPPEPPFVAVLPLYGASGGGESAGWRALWSHEPREMHAADPAVGPVEVLQRMQAKCTAPYAETAMSRTRYKLQVDADKCVTVDVPTWRACAAALDALTAALDAAACGYMEKKTAASTLRPPPPKPWHDARALVAAVRAWPSLIAPLAPHVGAVWYRKLLVEHLYSFAASEAEDTAL